MPVLYFHPCSMKGHFHNADTICGWKLENE